MEFVHADIRRPDDLVIPKTRFDLIVDCSAEPSVLAAYESGPSYVVDTNLVGSVNLFDLARRDGADVVFISTSRVYPVAAIEAIAYEEAPTRFVIAPEQAIRGVTSAGIGEDFPLEGARSLYGTTKLACEMILEEYAQMYGLRYVIDRCGVITGPWQMGKVDQGVFALWMGRHYFKRPLSFIGYGGTGKQVRDFVAVDELADLVLDQIGRIDALPRRVYNVGGGTASSLSLLELTQLCEEVTGNRVEMTRVAENRPSDVRLYITDNARVTGDLNWFPCQTPKQTMEQLYSWIRENERLVAPLWS
ncbi:3-beta hydroxysteroid dehydrogenase [Vulcanimicrobium alpinum]|uniref:3-beta hydroxysteroid dehydrogenase n=1 Tax=Vulcanimicrobium alpinum TaxID=3016050 RepID=A0AAN1XYE9_UNVUL|nr:3-beta hydroxysteroid dehydrogenase [Vulcanimicrobium alpinum]